MDETPISYNDKDNPPHLHEILPCRFKCCAKTMCEYFRRFFNVDVMPNTSKTPRDGVVCIGGTDLWKHLVPNDDTKAVLDELAIHHAQPIRVVLMFRDLVNWVYALSQHAF